LPALRADPHAFQLDFGRYLLRALGHRRFQRFFNLRCNTVFGFSPFDGGTLVDALRFDPSPNPHPALRDYIATVCVLNTAGELALDRTPTAPEPCRLAVFYEKIARRF
jgi:hypothetical protein